MFRQALRLGLGLNDLELLVEVYRRISIEEIPLIVKMVPARLLPALLNLIRCFITPESMKPADVAKLTSEVSCLFQVHITWLSRLMTMRTAEIADSRITGLDNRGTVRSLLLMILKDLQSRKDLLGELIENNVCLLDFLSTVNSVHDDKI